MYRAGARGDNDDLLGMLSRGEIVELANGTQLLAAATSEDHVAVSIESGFNRGTICWVPRKVLDAPGWSVTIP